MVDDDELAQRVTRMRARSQEVKQQANRRAQANEWADRQLAAIEGTAASADGLVRATVDAHGVLTRLELSPSAQRARASELSRAVTAVVRNAVADARTRVRDVYATLRDEGVRGDIPGLPPAPPTEVVTLRLAPASTQVDPPRLASTPDSTAEPAERQSRPTGSRTAPDAANQYLKDRSLPGYDVVPRLPEVEEPDPLSDDEWYSEKFRVKRTY